ncbi:Astra associated protein 1 Asa1 [Malassezia yamatoensis]|uniref:ASTRA-associated protein 1 n=1 Tax=Malassezia yamatoensis TaxID=253288 RepID=A0AAJ5YP20_9BASI|nr:Astra associated protein 1 Asa1 [Malassezia yamatoensis]
MTDTISAWGGELDPPQHVLRVDVNALNYCAYDLATTTEERLEGYLAVPNTLESAYIDIYALHDKKRIIEAVGHAGVLGRGLERPPIVMSLCLTIREGLTWLVAGYEDGSVQAWTMSMSDAHPTTELCWSLRPHKESVMALTLTPDHQAVVSVGADQRLVRITLNLHPAVDTFSLPRPGNASVAVRADQQISAVGGWDGGVRIVSQTKKLLATLLYHKQGIGSVAFIRRNLVNTLTIAEMDSDEEDSRIVPAHLLAVGAKDGRVSLWDTPFTVADVTPALRAP